jgi:hypothetical protein
MCPAVRFCIFVLDVVQMLELITHVTIKLQFVCADIEYICEYGIICVDFHFFDNCRFHIH